MKKKQLNGILIRKPFFLKQMRLIISIWLISTVLSFSGCASLGKLMAKPTVTFSTLQVTKASLIDSTMIFNFKVANPNPFSLWANRIAYHFKLNGQSFFRGTLDKGLLVSSNGTNSFQLPVTVNYLQLFDSVMDMTLRKNAAYDLTGNFTAGPITIPFSAKGIIDLPKMPKLLLENVNIENLSFQGAKLHCRLTIDNPNAFALNFNHLEYSLKLGGMTFSRATAKPKQPIPGKGKTAMDVNINASFSDIGFGAYQLLKSSKSDYKLEGLFEMTSLNGEKQIIPFSIDGEVPFSNKS
ncbi:MAG: LEA type 2 family protein [Desulfobacteraceae bacterium]|nr:LEA type 2 family protein [Desulfobacteraceae bacterium]